MENLSLFLTLKLLIFLIEKPALGEKLDSLKDALKTLPPAHYQTLKFLMAHLYRWVLSYTGWFKYGLENIDMCKRKKENSLDIIYSFNVQFNSWVRVFA